MTDKDFSNLTRAQAKIFKAVSYPTRLEIVKLLGEKGPLSVYDIVEALNIEYANASRHLSKLANAGIVNGERRGRNVYYSLKCECIYGFLQCLNSFILEKSREQSRIIDEL